jgi:hypothetical protein
VLVSAVDGSVLEFLPGALEAFKELCGANDVYLVTTVSEDGHASTVRELMEREGMHEAGLDSRVREQSLRASRDRPTQRWLLTGLGCFAETAVLLDQQRERINRTAD